VLRRTKPRPGLDWADCAVGGRLKLRYLGTARNNAWLRNRTAALNLRTLISRGLARENGTWALA
jgi:hypothetical protein